MKRLRMSLIFLTAVSLNSCYDPVNEEFSKIDKQLNQCRVYKVIQSKPELKFKYVRTELLDYCSSGWSLTNKQAADFIKNWNAEQAKGD